MSISDVVRVAVLFVIYFATAKFGLSLDAVSGFAAAVWPPTGGGSAMGTAEERKNFLTQVRKSCAIAKKLKDIGIRKYGIVTSSRPEP